MNLYINIINLNLKTLTLIITIKIDQYNKLYLQKIILNINNSYKQNKDYT